MTRSSVSSRLARVSVLGSASALLVFACSSGEGTRDDSGRDEPIRVGEARAQLTRVDSCNALLVSIQDNLVAQLEQRGIELRNGSLGSGAGGGVAIGSGGAGPVRGEDDSADAPPQAAPSGNPGATPSPTPSAPTDPGTVTNGGNSAGESPGGGGTAGTGGGDFSGTTVQIKDVDEADILKAEGDRLFLLHGGTLFVLKAWPADSTAILGSRLLEGTPNEMFVKDGKAVVFSTVYGPSGIQPAAGVAIDYYYPSWGYTKISVLDVSGDEPSLLRESYLEGGYVSSRRHDGLVRAVVQDGFKVPSIGYPNVEYYDPFGNRFAQADIDAQVNAWLDRVERSIRAADLSDFLPREFTRTNGALVAEPPRCEDYYAPDPGLTQSGVTSVVALDLDAPTAALSGATILGNAERIYANEEVLLVTQTDYRWELGAGDSEQTVIHRFDIDGPSTSYTASGFIAGTINDQFSLDELNGVIRVSTTENRWGRGVVVSPQPAPAGVAGSGGAAVAPPVVVSPPVVDGPVNRVVTLGTQGDDLVQLGATDDFGLTERIYSTRFIGDKGYVVTFRQTDPFFVVDLSDPTDPHVVGELKIPGFSNFLFPLGPDHLFAIGQEANAQGIVQGLALSIFDVSDPTNPVLAQPKYVFPEQGVSLANVNHRAITFHADQDLVSFPYQSYETGESRLEIFHVSAADGLSRLGDMSASVTPPSLDECLVRMGYGKDPATLAEIDANPEWRASILRECQYYGGPQFVRGVFRDDFVYGITNVGVYAYALDGLNGMPVGQVRLPVEVYDQGSGGGYSYPTPDIAVPPQPALPPSTGGAAGASGGSSGGAGGMAAVEDDKPAE